MLLEWYKSQSTEKPAYIDKTSSKVYVYIRQNIEEIQVPAGVSTGEEENTETVTNYVYQEAKIKKSVWEKNESQISAELDYMESQQLITDLELDHYESQQSITDLELEMMEV